MRLDMKRSIEKLINELIDTYKDDIELKTILKCLNETTDERYKRYKVIERLRLHPCTEFMRHSEIIPINQSINTSIKDNKRKVDNDVFNDIGKKITDSLKLKLHDIVYDDKRNVEMNALVYMNINKPFEISYHFKRKTTNKLNKFMKKEKIVAKKLHSSVIYSIYINELYGQKKRLLKLQLSCTGEYPTGFYDEENKVSNELIEDFDFNENVFEEIDHLIDLNLTIEQTLSFILSMPFYEDEWMIDDKICDLILGNPMDEIYDSDAQR